MREVVGMNKNDFVEMKKPFVKTEKVIDENDLEEKISDLKSSIVLLWLVILFLIIGIVLLDLIRHGG